jgi:chromosome segregation ATPase
MSVLPLKSPHRGGQDDRRALRAAIEAARKAEQAIEARKGAIARARQLVEAASRKVEAAAAGIVQAKNEHARIFADAAERDGSEANGSGVIRAARLAELDAQDQIEAANAALARLEQGLADVEQASRLARNVVLREVNRVCMPHAARLLAEAKELKAKLAARRHVLQFLFGPENRDEIVGGWSSTMDEIKALEDRREPLAGLYRGVSDFLGTINVHDDGKRAAIEWERAREALGTDPDTPLPAI